MFDIYRNLRTFSHHRLTIAKMCMVLFILGSSYCFAFVPLLPLLHAAPQLTPVKLPLSATPTVEVVGSIGGSIGTIVVQGGMAYIGEGSGMSILDVRTPTQPVRIAHLPLSTAVKDMCIIGSLIYALNDKLVIIDISKSASPYILHTYDIPAGSSKVQVVNNRVYIISGTKLSLFDMTTSATLTLRSSYVLPAFAYDLQVVGSLVCIADGTNGLQIIDVSNPSLPILRGSYGIVGYAASITVLNNLAYITANTLNIVDITNPSNPILRSASLPLSSAQDIQVLGNLAYIADGGLKIIDISNSTNPIVRGSYSMMEGISYYWRVSVTDGVAYVIDDNTGLQILDIHTPATPTRYSVYEQHLASKVQLINNLAFVGGGRHPFWIADISDPTHPEIRGSYSMDIALFEDMQIVNNLAYIVVYLGVPNCSNDPCGRLLILDVAQPNNPLLVSSYNLSYSRNINVVGNLAYLAGYPGIIILDVTNPSTPVIRGTYTTNFFARDVQVSGTTAYLVGGNGTTDVKGGMDIVDVSDPARPVLRSHYALTGEVERVHVTGNYAYLVSDQGLWIVDIRNPLNPTLTGQYTMLGGYDVTVVDTQAYVTSSRGWFILDIHDPTKPIVQSTYPERTESLVVRGNTIVLGSDDLRILRFAGSLYPPYKVYLPAIQR